MNNHKIEYLLYLEHFDWMNCQHWNQLTSKEPLQYVQGLEILGKLVFVAEW